MNYLIDIFVLVLLIGGGGYALYSCFRLKKERVLFDNKILYPSSCTPDTCIDANGFIDYILPRMTIFGIVCLIAAAVTVLSIWVDLGALAQAAETVLVLCACVYMAIIQNRASKLYW